MYSAITNFYNRRKDKRMKVNITETVLRDANQSLIATRLPYEKFEGALSLLDKAGYYSLECWGGATFDSCLRYLDEDPWERLRKIKKVCKNTKLQMLLRGQNILGYKHYPDDIVREFIKHAADCGMDIIRIFDALNDMRNIQVAMDQTKKSGLHASGAICYTISPIHTLEKNVQTARELRDMGADSICIKDMAGIMSPKEAYDLVKAIKAEVDLPVVVHTHSTTGLGSMTLLKAVEAGADTIDTAISCFSNGTSQPPTESLVYALEQFGYETGVNQKITKEINDYFKPIQDEYLKSGLLDPVVMTTSTEALLYQIPGGMLSNLVAQLKAQKALDKLEDVLAETPRVREDLGYPPLVTPMSQMVGVQATANVLTGERYKNVSKEVVAYLRGEYGRAPGTVNPDLVKKILGDEEPMTGRYADTLEPAFQKAKEELGSIARSDEDVLSYVAFPQVAEKFFKAREEKENRNVKYTIREID